MQKSPYFIIAFIVVFTNVSILFNLVGSFCIAKNLNYDGEISYRGVGICKANKDPDFPITSTNKVNEKQINSEDVILFATVPLLSYGIGIVALLYVYIKRKNSITFEWTAIFLGLFFLRGIFIFILYLIYLFTANTKFLLFDEVSLALTFDMPVSLTLLSISAFSGLAIIYLIKNTCIKYFITKFFLLSFIGGLLGIAIWYKLIGPILLP